MVAETSAGRRGLLSSENAGHRSFSDSHHGTRASCSARATPRSQERRRSRSRRTQGLSGPSSPLWLRPLLLSGETCLDFSLAAHKIREIWERRKDTLDCTQAWKTLAAGNCKLDMIGALLLRVLLGRPSVLGLWSQKLLMQTLLDSTRHILSPDGSQKDLLPLRVDCRLSCLYWGLCAAAEPGHLRTSHRERTQRTELGHLGAWMLVIAWSLSFL